MNKEEIIQSAINLNPDNLTGSDAKVLCEYICDYVLSQNQIISNEQDIKDRTKDTLLLLSFLSEIRNVFFEKAELYRQNLIDLYTTELSKIKGFTNLPEKHSMYIKNNYEFRKIALASVIDVQEQFVLSWTGNNTYDWNELDEKYTKELNLLRLKIQQYERNLYVQQKSDTKVKLHINSIKRAIDDNETLGADNTTLQNSLSHFQLLKEEIDLTKQMEVDKTKEFLSTKLNQPRMKAIHQYLYEEMYIEPDEASWLYWFDLQPWLSKKKKPSRIKWKKASSVLSNVIYILCGNMGVKTETAMKSTFVLPKGTNFQKMTITKKKPQSDKEPYKSIHNMIEFAERYIKDLQ